MYSSQQLAQLYQTACIDELQALKPGNVHIFADGHRMVLDDFLQSAESSALPISQSEISVGERIFNAVKATHLRVGQNTNLGIVLLCAPIIHSALQINLQAYDAAQKLDALKSALNNTLNQLNIADAEFTAKAIVLANPAGLSTTQEHDVHEMPKVGLLEMMRYAQDEDRIAWQYAYGFEDIFSLGIQSYQAAMTQWENVTWATSWVYLNFLCAFLDTHVLRKHGLHAAQVLQNAAKSMRSQWLEATHPRFIKKQLLVWDSSLKLNGINPGTSADLTVATLLITKLL